jgi:HEAT repeat protein
MTRTPRPVPALEKKLEALVKRIVPGGRAQVQDLIASVIAAGGVSERALLEMLGDRARAIRLRADIAWLISRLGLPSASGALRTLLADPSPELREEAARGLGPFSGDDVVEALLGALARDAHLPVRCAAVEALGMIGSPRSSGRLIELLGDGGEAAALRADAAEALAHVRDERIVGALLGALDDGSPLVRYAAAYALGQQGDARALPALRRLAARDDATTPWGRVATCARESIEIIAGAPDRG